MPDFKFIKSSIPSNSFKVKAVKGAFDLNKDEIVETFEGSIPIEGKEWNIGLIVGPSGTGKSSIAKELFGNYFFNTIYSEPSVIDDMPKAKSWTETTQTFSSVGFASVPSWLKPYSVLSMGERMRVDLANSLLREQEIIIFDEYTSVIDRQVAQFGSEALQKAVRRSNKKFIAIGCHYDVIEWLQPDWIYDTKDNSFTFTKGAHAQKGSRLKYKLKNAIKKNGIKLKSIII